MGDYNQAPSHPKLISIFPKGCLCVHVWDVFIMLTGKDAEQEVPRSLDGFTWEGQNAVQEIQEPKCRKSSEPAWLGYYESKVRNGC